MWFFSTVTKKLIGQSSHLKNHIFNWHDARLVHIVDILRNDHRVLEVFADHLEQIYDVIVDIVVMALSIYSLYLS